MSARTDLETILPRLLAEEGVYVCLVSAGVVDNPDGLRPALLVDIKKQDDSLVIELHLSTIPEGQD